MKGNKAFLLLALSVSCVAFSPGSAFKNVLQKRPTTKKGRVVAPTR